MIHTLPAVVFCVLLLATAALFVRAAWIDITKMIIPNRLVVLMLAIDVLHGALPYPFGWMGNPEGTLLAAALDVGTAVLVFAALFLMWIPRWIGAGDVKLAGAASIGFGHAHALDFMWGTAVVGLVWGICLMVLRGRPGVWMWLSAKAPWLIQGTKIYFPYGPALCVGALYALALQCQDHGWIHVPSLVVLLGGE